MSLVGQRRDGTRGAVAGTRRGGARRGGPRPPAEQQRLVEHARAVLVPLHARRLLQPDAAHVRLADRAGRVGGAALLERRLEQRRVEVVRVHLVPVLPGPLHGVLLDLEVVLVQRLLRLQQTTADASVMGYKVASV